MNNKIMKKGLLKLKNKVEKFIGDNKLYFSDSGSGLNGNCTTLAGFICYVVNQIPIPISEQKEDGFEIIDNLKLSGEAYSELRRVFDFAFENYYERYWETEEARETYTF